VTTIREAPIEPGMPVPPILVIAPPPIQNPRGPIATKFIGADGIHLDADQHQTLGKALAHLVAALPDVLVPAA